MIENFAEWFQKMFINEAKAAVDNRDQHTSDIPEYDGTITIE